jgi:hypothetical protein
MKSDKVPRVVVRLRTKDPEETRRGYELVLGQLARKWRSAKETVDVEGVATIDYFIKPKKSTRPDELITLAKTAGGSQLIDADLR